jgi:predicted dehydrogenase
VTSPIWQVGIVGCGRIAGLKDRPRTSGPIATHAQAYHRNPAFRLAAVFSHPLQEAHRFGEIWGAPRVFPSLAAMLAPGNLDVISICSPSEFHFSQAQEILESPGRVKALWIEKPVCRTEVELHRLMELSEITGVVAAVNHTRRFDAAHRRAAHLLRSGKLGAFLKGRAVYYGGWLNNGVHLIDTMRMLLPEEPQVVAAVKVGSGKPGDDDLQVELVVGRGRLAVEAFDETYYQLFEMELLCEKGRLRLLDFGSRIEVELVEVNDLGERELKPQPDSPWQGLASPFYAAVEALNAQLRGQNVLAELGADLATARGTMNLIWQASKMAGA